jgi:predicted nucleic acid-binding protein
VAAFFFDSSALVKRYIVEIGTNWVNQVLNPATRHRIHVARITEVEVAAALIRRVHTKSISQADAAKAKKQFDQEMQTCYRIVEITPAVFRSAAQLAVTHEIRAYDAVQLAAAVVVHSRRTARKLPPLTLAASDQELLAAAKAEGLLVEDPQTHP